jgi:hypothetical protein
MQSCACQNFNLTRVCDQAYACGILIAVRIDLASDMCAVAKRRTRELRGGLPISVVLFSLLLQYMVQAVLLALAPVPERR